MSSSEELRKRYRAYWKAYDEAYADYEKECDRIFKEWVSRPMSGPLREPKFTFPPFPEELMGLTCGAKTRAETPCKLTSLYANGRCKFHGGLSTGPKTEAGKKKSALNGFQPKRMARSP